MKCTDPSELPDDVPFRPNATLDACSSPSTLLSLSFSNSAKFIDFSASYFVLYPFVACSLDGWSNSLLDPMMLPSMRQESRLDSRRLGFGVETGVGAVMLDITVDSGRADDRVTGPFDLVKSISLRGRRFLLFLLLLSLSLLSLLLLSVASNASPSSLRPLPRRPRPDNRLDSLRTKFLLLLLLLLLSMLISMLLSMLLSMSLWVLLLFLLLLGAICGIV